MNNKKLLSEIFRPRSINDLIVPDRIDKYLHKFVNARQIMNVTFYGSPGIGKTSAARILFKEIDADVYELNGSFNSGDKDMIKRIANFAATYSYEAKPKICFIDEADHMSNDVQEALRYVIEKTSDNCRYLFTANNIGKLTVAIKSRCVPISFDLMRNEVDQMIDKAVVRYIDRLSDIDAEIDSSRVRQICETYFPDYRSIANNFQLEI